MSWRTWNIGDKVAWHMIGISKKKVGEVTEMHEDHAIVSADGASFWFDDETDVEVEKVE